ncbi:MAG TPA: hypothetical protein VNZ52_16080 [Candidatus Thermoplasmatota archaeon]|nr:hypothetical protein [Candidatus Thermoplasmatota archaeon]
MSSRPLLLASLLLLLLTLPAVPVGAGTTECTGGATDGRSTNATGGLDPASEFIALIPPLRQAQPHDLWLSRNDFSLWEDSNGVPGIQRDARVCLHLDDEFRIVGRTLVYPADERLT